jgi:hypothetical protein
MGITEYKKYSFLTQTQQSHGFSDKTICERYRTLWNEVHDCIKNYNMERLVRVDVESFDMFILDYFTDIFRLKEFHDIEHTNVEKIYSYTCYWFVRRHPVQLISISKDNFDINEKIAVSLLVPKMLKELGISIGISNKPLQGDIGGEKMKNFVNLVFYNLKYRTFTPQSLELMVEAFFCGFYQPRP